MLRILRFPVKYLLGSLSPFRLAPRRARTHLPSPASVISASGARGSAILWGRVCADVCCGGIELRPAITWLYPDASCVSRRRNRDGGERDASDDAGRVMVCGAFLRLLPGPPSSLLSQAVLLSMASVVPPRLPVSPAGLMFLLIVGDLSRSARVNPVFDAAYLAEAQWLRSTKLDLNSRFYVRREDVMARLTLGSRRLARLLQSSRPHGVCQPRRAERPGRLLSICLEVPRDAVLRSGCLWPKAFTARPRASLKPIGTSDRFLDRTGVRYRVLPDRVASGHSRVAEVPYFSESASTTGARM